MRLHAIDSLDGWTAAAKIAAYPGELLLDAVGLWQIVPDARDGYGFTREEMVEYVRLAVLELARNGARPVLGGGGVGSYAWVLQKQYGSEPEEIARTVVDEWVRDGLPDVDVGGLWFATPDRYNIRRGGALASQD